MKLSSGARKALPTAKFAGPDRSYPVNDKSHASNAKARASQAVNAGRMSSSEKAHIDAAANKVLHRGKADGSAMPHETHTPHADNVMGMHQFKKGTTHPDSKGSGGLDGDGDQHWSGH